MLTDYPPAQLQHTEPGHGIVTETIKYNQVSSFYEDGVICLTTFLSSTDTPV